MSVEADRETELSDYIEILTSGNMFSEEVIAMNEVIVILVIIFFILVVLTQN